MGMVKTKLLKSPNSNKPAVLYWSRSCLNRDSRQPEDAACIRVSDDGEQRVVGVVVIDDHRRITASDSREISRSDDGEICIVGWDRQRDGSAPSHSSRARRDIHGRG